MSMNTILLILAGYAAIALICQCVLYEADDDFENWPLAAYWPCTAVAAIAFTAYCLWLKIREQWRGKK